MEIDYPLVSIPAKKKIKAYLRQYSRRDCVHVGLNYAYTSSKHKRHHKNAYIVLLGQTGAGKSTTINRLFGQELAEVGDETSVTSQIFEYASPVEVMREVGVLNAEIHIIDTPGLGDVRGIEQDAKFIATMDDFLTNHSELKDIYPNMVILTVRMDDNRISGPASPFVRMIKGIKLIEDRLIDPEHCNIIVVLTHFMHMKKKIQLNPQENYELVKSLVREYGGFPDPIIVVAAENDGDEYDLENTNGYWKLPCGEYYPYNLFDGITKLCGRYDPMGAEIIKNAFSEPETLNAETVSTKYLIEDSSHPLFSKAVGELIGNQFANQKSEVSDKLKSTWNVLISPDLRKSYPEALVVTQTVFLIRNIRNISDIPKDSTEQIRLIRSIPQNEAILALLRKGLDISAPTLKIPFLVGQGYNLLSDKVLNSTPFAKCAPAISALGYALPTSIRCEILDEMADLCVKVDSHQQYTKRRMADLGLAVGNVDLLERSEIRPGYNILNGGSSKLSMVKEYRKFKLVLKDEFTLSDEFIEVLRRLEKPDHNNIENWTVFFVKFGTHIIRQAYGGGSIEFTMEGQNFMNQVEKCGGKGAILQKLENMESEIISGIISDTRLPVPTAPKLRGGDKNIADGHWDLGSESSEVQLENWVESLDVSPIMLETKLRLVPLSAIVKVIDARKARYIDMAMSYTMQNSLGDVTERPDVPFIPPVRKQVKHLMNADLRSSCLKEGTRILMSDFTSKPVEKIMAGDKILDKDLNPSLVLGCNYFFLGDRHFYGFSADSQFFTEVHLFLGPGMELRVVSKDALLEENPAMENFGQISQMEGAFDILRYCENVGVVERSCRLHVDTQVYPTDTKVYFIEVDNPTGTYFANEFLCRHELPPFHLWPNTFDCLQRTMLSPKIIMRILNEPFTPSTLAKFSRIGKSVVEAFKDSLDCEKNVGNTKEVEECDQQSLLDISKNLSLVLENKSLAAFGLLLYGKCGKTLYEHLDKQIVDKENANVNISYLFKSIVEEKVSLL